MTTENLKVAVRVRGFNDREKEMKCKCTVDMVGNQTMLKSFEEPDKKRTFAFDYSYWSFDGFKTEDDGYLAPDSSHPNGSKYCDQKRIFKDLGLGILNNAWEGYNASLFAYGQTGSGKSYSIAGKGSNKGMVPLVFETLFKQINEKKSSGDVQFEVTFTMIEIYNEIARDLLSSNKKDDRKGLPIHETTKGGFQILEKDLKPTPIYDYASFEKLLEKGNANRIIASTKMNANSSRAHTIVELTFKQIFKSGGKDTHRKSEIDLIDLAGSERASKSGTEGDRFKEGTAINLSLTWLGNCISALASKESGKKVEIPYRESILTKLLKKALGGNSKTIMIAAISPADNNYDETLSTLRYADNAKQIKCKPIVNEDVKDLLIRQLQEENSMLKERMKNGGIVELGDGLTKAEYERLKKEMEDNMKKQIENNEKELESLRKSYEEKLAEAQRQASEINKFDVNEKSKILPHLSNINIDPILTGSLKHLIEVSPKKKKFIIGSSEKVDIVINGLGVQERHACITCEDDKFFMEPYVSSRVIKNGKQMDAKFKMENLDRLVFGASLYYIFVNPNDFTLNGEVNEALMDTRVNEISYEKLQQEIAEESGLISRSDINRQKPEDIACLNDLIDLMPGIEEANQMSILLDKKVKYKAIIFNPLVMGEPDSKIQPMVVVRKFGTNIEWIWDKDKFIDRKCNMSEMYWDIKEDGKIDKEKFKSFDPFFESDSQPVHVGTGLVEPRCLLHMVPLQENVRFFDYKKNLAGTLNIEMLPCDESGKVFKNLDEVIIQNPEKELKKLHFLVKINNVRCMSPKYKNIYCQFKTHGSTGYFKTTIGKDTNNPDIDYKQLISYNSVDKNLIKAFTNPIFIQVYGAQKALTNESNKMSTKDWFESEKKAKNSTEALREEISGLQQELDRTKKIIRNVEYLINFAENKKGKSRIKIDYIRECLLSNQPEVLNKIIHNFEKSNEKE